MGNTGMVDVADAYEGNLLQPYSEPEVGLPETTEAEAKKKGEAYEKKMDLLQKGIDTDVGADGTQIGTQMSGVPVKDEKGTKISTFEYSFDKRLKAKKDWMADDLKRLREKFLKPVDNNIKESQAKQKEINSYASLVHGAIRSTRSYLQSTKAARRSKKAGNKAGVNVEKPPLP